MKNKEELKFWIKDNLFNHLGLNPARVKTNYFISNFKEKYEEILDLTRFLDENSKNNERIYCVLNDIIETKICKICNKKVRFVCFSVGYKTYCSDICANKDPEIAKNISIHHNSKSEEEKHEINEKIKKTNIERYGVENVMFSERIKEEIRKTNLEKYGVESTFSVKEIRDKIKETIKNRYGVENISQNKEIQKKIRKSILKTVKLKYGEIYDNINQINVSEESLKKLKDKDWLLIQHHKLEKTCTEIGSELGIVYGTVISWLKKHDLEVRKFYASSYEKEILNFIKNVCDKEINHRIKIKNKEIDIFIPYHRVAIEFNGLFYHSYDRLESRKEKNKHLYKTNICYNNNIQLFHIFENEWLDPVRQDIWKSMISGKLNKNNRIYARKCEIKEIYDNKSIKKFLDENHIQGHVGSSIKLGLFYNNELVSLMTFSKPRYNKKYQYELVRFCNKKYTSTIGGASKLFKYFLDNYNPESIISYADLRYSNGNMYNKLKMEYAGNSRPKYYYINNKKGDKKMLSRTKFQKHKLSGLLDNFESQLSETQNMFNNGYRRIWDCGNMIFTWKKANLKP
jgi:hypothetical protein